MAIGIGIGIASVFTVSPGRLLGCKDKFAFVITGLH